MKDLKRLCLILSSAFLSSAALAQDPVTLLEKNRTSDIIELKQNLNKTEDTLILKSDLDILKITVLQHNNEESVEIILGAKSIMIPLYHFPLGRHTIAVYRVDKIIALSINRLAPISTSVSASANLEESILRASLSEDEQIALKMQASTTDKPAAKDATTLAHSKPKSKAKVEPMSELENKSSAEAKPLDTAKASPRNTKKVKYNLTKIDNDVSVVRQSRAQYRANNLRPNGRKYD